MLVTLVSLVTLGILALCHLADVSVGDVTHELVTTNFAPALRDLLSPHGGVESGLYNCQLILRWFSL